MPRFYFHFSCSGIHSEDRRGRDLASLAEAHQHALELVDRAISHFDDGQDWRGWAVRICEPRGQPRLHVLFARTSRAARLRRTG